MPEMDGISATDHIRSFGTNAPIVAMTSNIRQHEVEVYIGHGEFARPPAEGLLLSAKDVNAINRHERCAGQTIHKGGNVAHLEEASVEDAPRSPAASDLGASGRRDDGCSDWRRAAGRSDRVHVGYEPGDDGDAGRSDIRPAEVRIDADPIARDDRLLALPRAADATDLSAHGRWWVSGCRERRPAQYGLDPRGNSETCLCPKPTTSTTHGGRRTAATYRESADDWDARGHGRGKPKAAKAGATVRCGIGPKSLVGHLKFFLLGAVPWAFRRVLIQCKLGKLAGRMISIRTTVGDTPPRDRIVAARCDDCCGWILQHSRLNQHYCFFRFVKPSNQHPRVLNGRAQTGLDILCYKSG
jgi:CheY-like chemotaxis protein